MALPTTFYVTFEFSNLQDFSVKTTQTLAVAVVDVQWQDESDPRTAGGGKRKRNSLFRPVIEVEYWPFETNPASAYPDGQDEADWRQHKINIRDNRFMRISASNAISYADFPSDNPLPIEVVPTGNLVATKDAKAQLRKVTVQYEAVDRA